MLPEASHAPGPDQVRAALAISNFDSVAAWRAMMPESRRLYPAQRDQPPTPAAVLLLLFPRRNEWRIVLTRRSASLRGHSGQISFPGGRIDAGDVDARAAALRETREELGIQTEDIILLGELRAVYIPPTHYEVQTQVGLLPSEPTWRPNPREVAEVLTMSLSALLDKRHKGNAQREVRGREVRVPYYEVYGHQVWGATALILSELEGRLCCVLERDA